MLLTRSLPSDFSIISNIRFLIDCLSCTVLFCIFSMLGHQHLYKVSCTALAPENSYENYTILARFYLSLHLCFSIDIKLLKLSHIIQKSQTLALFSMISYSLSLSSLQITSSERSNVTFPDNIWSPDRRLSKNHKKYTSVFIVRFL